MDRVVAGFNGNGPDDNADNPLLFPLTGEKLPLFSCVPINVMEVHFNLNGPSGGLGGETLARTHPHTRKNAHMPSGSTDTHTHAIMIYRHRHTHTHANTHAAQS